ncbi:MAG: dienelactone hydrolase family protein [Desulfovibrio sp.]|nr:dienelactone hydrolase family protein [Desulfovibrio sp.]
MTMRLLLAIAALLTLAACGSPVRAADAYQVGFRTLGQWLPEAGLRLDVNVWYPSIRPPRDLNYAPWEFAAARGGKPVDGRFPLLLLSHDTAGTRFSYHDTASALASLGFVVAAPNHPTDNMDNMDDLLTWKQLESRTRELAGTIDLLLATPDMEPSIDHTRMGVIGFGAGGTAALLLGGALPNCENWPAYCAAANPADMYCHVWARKRMDALCRRLPLTKSPADTRIKAVAAVAPAFGMLFSHASFRWFYPPLLLVDAGNDAMNVTRQHARHIFEMLDKKPRWRVLPQADAGALMAPCPPSLADELPELCRSVTPETRDAVHERLQESLRDFFLHYLGGDKDVPHIPPPPDLTPPAPAPRQERAAPSARPGKRR